MVNTAFFEEDLVMDKFYFNRIIERGLGSTGREDVGRMLKHFALLATTEEAARTVEQCCGKVSLHAGLVKEGATKQSCEECLRLWVLGRRYVIIYFSLCSVYVQCEVVAILTPRVLGRSWKNELGAAGVDPAGITDDALYIKTVVDVTIEAAANFTSVVRI
jgi:hypothetical protein